MTELNRSWAQSSLGPADALNEGVHFYELPEKLTPAQVDEELRKAVFRINESLWVWTAESCAGHWGGNGWAGNVRPMIRLVCRKADLAAMLRHLYLATLYDAPGTHYGLSAIGFTVWHFPTRYPNFHEALVYMEARTEDERLEGIKTWERFAERVNDSEDFDQMVADGVDPDYVQWLREQGTTSKGK